MQNDVVLDGNSLTVEQVAAVARDRAPVSLAPHARPRARLTRLVVEGLVARRAVAYGVTTGFGKLSEIAIPPERLAELPGNLGGRHAAGGGGLLAEREGGGGRLLR